MCARPSWPSGVGLCSSTPRGDGNPSKPGWRSSQIFEWFMQLNPARGRKHAECLIAPGKGSGVYAAQPREGTETLKMLALIFAAIGLGLCSSTPRGDGNSFEDIADCRPILFGFMQLNPARGRKPFFTLESLGSGSTVYAAQPREGTETCPIRADLCTQQSRFMQLNPARGRKLGAVPISKSHMLHGLCSSTPRGDGNYPSRISSIANQFRGLCSSTPRGDGNFKDYEEE